MSVNVHIGLQNWQKSAVNCIKVQSWASADSRLVTAASAQNLSVHQIQGLWRQKSHNLRGFTQWHIHSVRSRQWFSSTQCLMLDQCLVCRKQETSICCMSLDMDTEMFTFDWCLVLCIYFRTLKLRVAFATQSSSWQQQQQHTLRETQCNVKCQSDPRQRHAKHLHTTWTPANLPFLCDFCLLRCSLWPLPGQHCLRPISFQCLIHGWNPDTWEQIMTGPK